MKKKLPRKFIAKAKIVEISKSPSIFRRIAAVRLPTIPLIPEKELIVGFACGCLIVGIAVSAFKLQESVKEYELVLGERKSFAQQKTYWESVTRQFPSYRDAHFRAGVLAFQEGRKQAARTEVIKALELDPSFTEARVFLQKIEGK